MDFATLVEQRASCRRFRPDPVPPEDLREMVRIAGLAPSPNNAQPWRFIAVVNQETLGAMGAAVRDHLHRVLPDPVDEPGARARARVEWFSTFFAEAPATIAVTLAPYRAVIDELLEETKSQLTHDSVNEMRMLPDLQSVGAAVEHLLLAAANMGYGGCWVSGPLMARSEVESILGIQAPERLTAMVAVGKPALLQAEGKDRKPVDDIFEIRM
jgi:nitroreductase